MNIKNILEASFFLGPFGVSGAKALLHGSLQIALPDPAEGSDDVADHIDHDLMGFRV